MLSRTVHQRFFRASEPSGRITHALEVEFKTRSHIAQSGYYLAARRRVASQLRPPIVDSIKRDQFAASSMTCQA